MGFLKSTLSINKEDMKVSLTRSSYGNWNLAILFYLQIVRVANSKLCETSKDSQFLSLVLHSHTLSICKDEEYTLRKRFTARIYLEICGLINACMPIVVNHTVNITSRIQTLGKNNVCSYIFFLNLVVFNSIEIKLEIGY